MKSPVTKFSMHMPPRQGLLSQALMRTSHRLPVYMAGHEQLWLVAPTSWQNLLRPQGDEEHGSGAGVGALVGAAVVGTGVTGVRHVGPE